MKRQTPNLQLLVVPVEILNRERIYTAPFAELLHVDLCATAKPNQRAPSYQHEPGELRTAHSTNPDHLQEPHTVFVPGGISLKAHKPKLEATV